ncbi:ribonuclease HI [Trypanosoma cruzi]|nr:ribonuclease HI [Trypanosoma cruzi]
MTTTKMMGDGTVRCGAPRVRVLEEGVSCLSMQTTALVLLRHVADQRAMRLGTDSRRISKITASGPTVPKALACSTKTAAVRSCGALRCMAALMRSNWSGVELPGKKPDGCRVNWDSMTSRMRAAGVREGESPAASSCGKPHSPARSRPHRGTLQRRATVTRLVQQRRPYTVHTATREHAGKKKRGSRAINKQGAVGRWLCPAHGHTSGGEGVTARTLPHTPGASPPALAAVAP